MGVMESHDGLFVCCNIFLLVLLPINYPQRVSLSTTAIHHRYPLNVSSFFSSQLFLQPFLNSAHP
jgi:hypothetical protein